LVNRGRQTPVSPAVYKAGVQPQIEQTKRIEICRMLNLRFKRDAEVATMATRKKHMSTVGISELKNRLTEYLRLTTRGEEIIVTDRGRPIALIQSIDAARRPLTLEAKLAKAARQGLLELPTAKPSRRFRTVQAAGKPVSRVIIEDRG